MTDYKFYSRSFNIKAMLPKDIEKYLVDIPEDIKQRIFSNILRINKEDQEASKKHDEDLKNWYKEQEKNETCFIVKHNDSSFCLMKASEKNSKCPHRYTSDIIRGESFTIRGNGIDYDDYIKNRYWLNNPFEDRVAFGFRSDTKIISRETYNKFTKSLKIISEDIHNVIDELLKFYENN